MLSRLVVSLRRHLHSQSALYVRDLTPTLQVVEEKMALEKRSLIFSELAESEERSPKMFLKAIDTYIANERVYRRGHVEFIEAALKQMNDFGVNTSLDAYKKVMDIFPPDGQLVAQNVWQVEFFHYPRQQDTALSVLEQMEYNSVVPDDEMGYKLRKIFGEPSHVFRKYARQMYWMPKLANINPWPVPKSLPKFESEVARRALSRMAPDPLNKTTVFDTTNVPSELADHLKEARYIAFAQSPAQRRLISQLSDNTTIYLTGPSLVWFKQSQLNYWTLRGPRTYPLEDSSDTDRLDGPVTCRYQFGSALFDSNLPAEPLTVHHQEEGMVLALIITGSGSRSSLLTALQLLQLASPHLAHLSVVFSAEESGDQEAGLGGQEAVKQIDRVS